MDYYLGLDLRSALTLAYRNCDWIAYSFYAEEFCYQSQDMLERKGKFDLADLMNESAIAWNRTHAYHVMYDNVVHR